MGGGNRSRSRHHEKNVFIATPMLDDIGGGDLIKKGVDAIGKYDQFKSQVSDIDQRARGYASTVDKANIFE